MHHFTSTCLQGAPVCWSWLHMRRFPPGTSALSSLNACAGCAGPLAATWYGSACTGSGQRGGTAAGRRAPDRRSARCRPRYAGTLYERESLQSYVAGDTQADLCRRRACGLGRRAPRSVGARLPAGRCRHVRGPGSGSGERPWRRGRPGRCVQQANAGAVSAAQPHRLGQEGSGALPMLLFRVLLHTQLLMPESA